MQLQCKFKMFCNFKIAVNNLQIKVVLCLLQIYIYSFKMQELFCKFTLTLQNYSFEKREENKAIQYSRLFFEKTLGNNDNSLERVILFFRVGSVRELGMCSCLC